MSRQPFKRMELNLKQVKKKLWQSRWLAEKNSAIKLSIEIPILLDIVY